MEARIGTPAASVEIEAVGIEVRIAAKDVVAAVDAYVIPRRRSMRRSAFAGRYSSGTCRAPTGSDQNLHSRRAGGAQEILERAPAQRVGETDRLSGLRPDVSDHECSPLNSFSLNDMFRMNWS